MGRDAHFRAVAEARSDLNAFISFTAESGDGDVVAVKDSIDVRGVPTTGGGIVRPRTPAAGDAPVIERVRRAGGMIIGKTNLHEWNFGPTNINPHYGTTCNPADPRRISGGSSGGSAVAVAAGMCDWAIGTDSGGSIRIPASLCGVVGFKPTVGSIDTRGIIPLSSTLDAIGPMGPDVLSVATAFETMAGSSVRIRDGSPNSAILGVADGWVSDLDAATARTWEWVKKGLPSIQLPGREDVAAVGRTIIYWEAAAYHRASFAAHPELYGKDVREYLTEGMKIRTGQYEAALARVQSLRTAVDKALKGWDAVLLPATACVAPPIGPSDVREPLTRFTRPFSVTGHPVIVLPAKSASLPVGIQVVGHFGGDAELLRLALGLEHELRLGHRQSLQLADAPR